MSEKKKCHNPGGREIVYPPVYPGLYNWIKENGYTYKSFAEAIGFTSNRMTYIMSGTNEPRKGTIDLILEFTGLTYEVAFKEGKISKIK